MALKERRLTWGFLLLSVTWSSAQTYEGSSVSPIFHRSTPPATETGMNSTEAPTRNYTGVYNTTIMIQWMHISYSAMQ